MTPHARVAIDFATALVKKDFAFAQSLLAPELRKELTPAVLQARLTAMYEGYTWDDEPKSVWFDESLPVLEDWPEKRPGEIAWVYVGIEGEEFNEAVYVLVAAVAGKLLIRQVEWGRP